MVDQPKKRAPWWTRTGTAVADDGTPLAFAMGGPDDAIVVSLGKHDPPPIRAGSLHELVFEHEWGDD